MACAAVNPWTCEYQNRVMNFEGVWTCYEYADSAVEGEMTEMVFTKQRMVRDDSWDSSKNESGLPSPWTAKVTKGCLTFQAHVNCVCGGRFVIRAVNLSNCVSVFDVTQNKLKIFFCKTRWRCELFYRGRIQHILIWITVNFFET